MDGVKFNGIISLYTKNDSERRRPMLLLSIFDDIIMIKVIYL